MSTNARISATAMASFMLAGNQTVSNLNIEQVKLYAKLIAEEANESIVAVHALTANGGITVENLQEVLDGAADVIVVAIGMLYSCGANPQAVYDAVMESNSSKVIDGKLVKRSDGKILKPDTYFAPNLQPIADDILNTRPNLRGALR